jgi:hypothetical protein
MDSVVMKCISTSEQSSIEVKIGLLSTQNDVLDGLVQSDLGIVAHDLQFEVPYWDVPDALDDFEVFAYVLLVLSDVAVGP